METELFGPVMTILFTKMLNGKIIRITLTGIFSQDRYAPVANTVTSISMTNQQVLSWQQPFGGARAFEQTTKRSPLNLLRYFTKNNQRNFVTQ
jgi:hypothetical protein